MKVEFSIETQMMKLVEGLYDHAERSVTATVQRSMHTGEVNRVWLLLDEELLRINHN